ncbi:MAG: N-6 DNA methylase [Chloroflexi bacterium]|nr:N-6 DNA methylase [Chloroflexota bacterium]
MLDTDTKRRIDTARDILVGKVPDPKSQVEQITIALIYKFMDDMDAESEELGGNRKFFAGDFERYGWAKLMRAGLGGHETLNLYAEAITRMPENPGIPPLFRDIFKNAYLPYRDPETLKMFLKVIDEFEYDHSERLGDAFEYLLSVLGSQGDAGQFRTPRHIIDFMVAILDPKKDEAVLDPACGTAGFLISSYKHILKANTDAKGHSTLTPDDRARLAQNFTGYDISPDMVRLSLVNMYLHGFADPHIFEYDTLTSLERWNHYADVILANPPFMSPKGGIQPHRRFSVQSKRSEVLFVDYMAEHLTPNGRAAIIVPEGIIFQSGSAYVQLRRMLVENSLVAVISLPAGVFNPYSGVKTSILILDKALAKKTDSIGFFKIENDGFSLGAQRREIDQNDLPFAKSEILDYLRILRIGNSLEDWKTSYGTIVSKEKITGNHEYNLTGEKYKVSKVTQSQWPKVKLSEICEFRSGLWKGEKEPLKMVKILRNTNFRKDGFLNLEDVAEHPVEVKQLESRLLNFGDIILEKSGGGPTQPVGRVALFNLHEGEYSYSNFTTRIRIVDDRANSLYVWLILNYLYKIGLTETLQKRTSGIRNLDNSAYQHLDIPLPPLEIQKEIVAEIEGYQKVIDGARAVVDNYRPHIPIDPDWPLIKLGDLCVIERGASPRPINDFLTDAPDGVNWIKIGDGEVGAKYISSTKQSITPSGASKSRRVKPGDFILSNSMSFGRPYIMATDGCIHDGWLLLRDQSENLDKDYLYNVLSSSFVFAQFEQAATGGVVNNLNSEIVRGVRIPLPPLQIQKAIAKEIETEQALVDANRELITRFEQKIQAVLAHVWGEDQIERE